MSNELNVERGQHQSTAANRSRIIDPFVILNIIVKNWYLFVLAIAIAIYGARFYISHTLPIYKTSTTLLINDTGERSFMNNDDLLQGLGLPASMRNIDNQINIIKSRELTNRVLNDLNFEIEYFYRTVKNLIPLYPNSPVRVLYDIENPLPKDIEFSISSLGNGMYSIVSENEKFVFSKQALFGEHIELNDGTFRVICLDENWFNINKDRSVHFIIYNRTNVVRHYSNRIDIESLSRSGSTLSVSLTSSNRAKDVDFLNKLTEVFLSLSLERKNREADRRIGFIDDQLIGISDSLMLTENKLQQFRSANRVMDISAQGQAIISQVMLLENERARLDLEANYYDYLSDYLLKDVSNELPIVPVTMGISDPGLTSLVTTLADLQGQLSSRGAGDMNPLQGLLSQRVRTTKDALHETLNGLKRANSLEMAENQKQVARINSQASALPATERQLLGFERKFRLNDELYTFLLQMRSEQQMQRASNTADSEVIDPADQQFSILVAPNTTLVYALSIFAGTAVPFFFLMLILLFNNKVKLEEIPRITNLPILGSIPRGSDKINTVVFDNPGSSISEAYRLIRSKIHFFTKDAIAPVILVTSSMPGEGKTFTSINLASIYSLLGKRTVLVGFDLRKPKIVDDFNLKSEAGVSTWLIGRDNLDEIIQTTNYENLSIITAGPIPPNPSELIALERTSQLFELLKERFEIIIIDTSPIGVVSDTYHLASLSDACLLVVRPGKTLRDLFRHTLDEIKISGVKGLALVVNDNKSVANQYGYGNKYGYTKDKVKLDSRWYGKKKSPK